MNKETAQAILNISHDIRDILRLDVMKKALNEGGLQVDWDVLNEVEKQAGKVMLNYYIDSMSNQIKEVKLLLNKEL